MDEKELMAEIEAQADRAEEAKPNTVDLNSLADALASKSDRSKEEIYGKLQAVWRRRGLFMVTVHR